MHWKYLSGSKLTIPKGKGDMLSLQTSWCVPPPPPRATAAAHEHVVAPVRCRFIIGICPTTSVNPLLHAPTSQLFFFYFFTFYCGSLLDPDGKKSISYPTL